MDFGDSTILQEVFDEENKSPVNDEVELVDDLYKSFSHGAREFHILDELNTSAANEEEVEEGNKENTAESDCSSNQESDQDGEFDLEEDEIDAMLDECKLTAIVCALSGKEVNVSTYFFRSS